MHPPVACSNSLLFVPIPIPGVGGEVAGDEGNSNAVTGTGGEVPVGSEGEKPPIETALEFTRGGAGTMFVICIGASTRTP